jgi:hypothetical protein
MTYEQLPLWFPNRIKTVMEHNGYDDYWITASTCNSKQHWSPLDLILREHYNNGDGSAKGFCGLTPAQNRKAYEYAVQNQQVLKELDLYSEKGWNNWGFPLWDKYQLH